MLYNQISQASNKFAVSAFATTLTATGQPYTPDSRRRRIYA